MNIYTDRFVDLTIYQCGQEQCTPGYAFGPASREHYLFHYVRSGRGTLYADDNSQTTHAFEIAAGQGFLIFPGQVTMYVADTADPWQYIWVEFDGLCVPEHLRATALTRETPVYRPASSGPRDRMEEEMLYLCEHPEAGQFHVIAHLYEFFACLVDSARTGRSPGARRIRDRYIRTALDYIENKYAEKIRIEDIAAECGIDRSYFGKIFHEVMGESPQSFLLHYRMMRASTLLQETDMSIAAVGVAVGYENALHFSRAFKSVYEMPPREWRTRYRKHPRQ